MARLAKAVHVKDPDRNRTVLLLPGEEPEPRLAALVTNPDAWEGGQLPAAEATGSGDGEGEGSDGENSAATPAPEPEQDTKKAAPAAKKTAATKRAASKPARGREAADQGDSGE